MTNVLRFRIITVLVLLLSMHISLYGQIFRGVQRRVERQPAARTVVPVSPTDAIAQLQRLANDIKENPRRITENDVNLAQKLLLDAVNELQRRLPREFDKETANDWAATFMLVELKVTLAKGTPDSAILEQVQNAFYSDKEGVRWLTFEGLRTALRRYQTITDMVKNNSYERRLNGVCDNLVNFIETYNEGRDPRYFASLSEAAVWLDDISPFEKRAARLAELLRAATSGVNVQLQIGSDFIAAGFRREIEQALDIDEMILKTKVVGSGTLSGRSSAELVPASNRAAIKIIADANIETRTDGRQRPVQLKTDTRGTLRGEKQVIFSADSISTTPARSRARLQSDISDVRINAGPIIRLIARGQIDSQREDAEQEAARRAERRRNGEMNDRIDSNVAKIDEKYQRIRSVLNKTGLFPRVWNLSSTYDQIDWGILLGDKYQPSAPVPAPKAMESNGLVVQVHQSAINNMLAIALAGRFIDEERFAKRIEEFMDEKPKFLEKNSDEMPAKVSFGRRVPVDVLFVDNKIRVVVRLNDIQVMDNVGRSFTMTVEYQVKMEDGKVLLEQTEAEAFPAGFNPNSGATLSTTQTIIRSYLLRRLEALPKKHVAEPFELKGEWEGKGELIPQFAAAENGWLTLVWDWKAAE